MTIKPQCIIVGERKKKDKCECDCGNGAQSEMTMLNSGGTYRLCLNCQFQLINLCLSKKQYLALLKNGHKANEFYLHDDFYDEDGTALQPNKIVPF